MRRFESDKRLIEVDFPLKGVSEESEREKKIYYKHISTLHTWWARRPLVASRASIFASLIPASNDPDKLKEKLDFILKLSKWENTFDKEIIERAQKVILEFFNGKTPKVLDCFAGGGSIPLEALRLGCETYALEYNPVAVLILKAVLEYPQKYGNLKIKIRGTAQKTLDGEVRLKEMPRLIYHIQKWGNWVYKEAKKEIGKFYPVDPDGNIPIGYIWARTVRCQNPSCKAEIPLMNQLWLAKKRNKVALKFIIDKKSGMIDFKIIKGEEVASFNPEEGTIKRATVQCPVCGSGMNGDTLRKEFLNQNAGQKLICVVLQNPRSKGKIYRVANQTDLEIFNLAEQYLEEKLKKCEWNFNPIPDEPTPSGEGPGAERAFSLHKYGLNNWGDLFNSRQKLALITFIDKVRLAYKKMVEEGYEEEYAKALVTYLAFVVSKLANFNSTLSMWASNRECTIGTFVRNALGMVWDYFEINPFSGALGSWESLLKWTSNSINACFGLPKVESIVQGTATRLPWQDGFFDAVITDPPYYDNVPYSDLSDFFYVWIKRTIGDLYPELFSTPLTPKSQEIIMHTVRHDKSIDKAKRFFEDMISQSFKEINRVLKPDGIAVIVFAYKSTDAWETIINSLLNSGLVLTASWPIHTERTKRMRAKESAVLASSVYMVCRKRTKEKIVYFNEIKEMIEQRIKEKLEQFWEQGIRGADFFVSAIGPAVEVFGQYARVEKLSGEEVSVKELLEYVRKVVSEFALERVLKRADFEGVDALTRFYLLWRWTFGNAKVHFDDAIKLSRSLGVELTDLWDKGGLVKKEKEFVKVLNPKERAQDQAFLKKTKFTSMIDVLHYVLILWERGEREKIKEILNETGYARNETFWQTAQALSEILPEGDKEKQLIQGFLYGKEEYIREARERKTLLDFIGGES